jgi:hypothetical protein
VKFSEEEVLTEIAGLWAEIPAESAAATVNEYVVLGDRLLITALAVETVAAKMPPL